MHRISSLVLAAFFFATASASAATLQVVIVAPDGSDTATCGSKANPCRTLNHSVTRVNAGGTIVADGPGNLGGTATINKALNFFGPPGAGIFAPNPPGPCLIINGGGNDTVNINGFTCDQDGAAQDGLVFNSGHKLKIDNATVRGNSGAKCGVRDKPTSGTSELIIQNSTFSENANAGTNIGGGICITPGGTAITSGVLDNVLLANNRHGFVSDPTGSATANFLIKRSTITGNEGGIFGVSPNSNTCVIDSTISGNTFMGVSGPVLNGGGNVIWNNAANGSFFGTCP